MSSHRITRSRSSLQQKNNSGGNDDDLLQRGDDDEGQTDDKSTNAAVAASSRNNGGGRKNNNIPLSDGSNQSSRRRLAPKQTVKYYESDEDDDESDEEDDESDFEEERGTTKTNKTDGNNQKKKRTYTKKKPLVTTTYKYPDDQFHISGWKKGKLPTPEEVLSRTRFYYERKMNEHENYSNVKVWNKFLEDGKAKGLFPKYWDPYQAKQWYNQSKAVAKGDLPDQPFPNFESTEQIIEARLYSHHTAAALRKTYNDLYEYGRQNGIQGLIMIPRVRKKKEGNELAEAYEKLGKLAGQGNEKAIKAYDFVHAVDSLHYSSQCRGEHYAKSLVELLENDGIVLSNDDEGHFSAHERRIQTHCHETFLQFVLGDEFNDIQLRRKINLTRDTLESKEKIHERMDEKYFVHASVTGIFGKRQIEFCQGVIANAGGVEAIEEMHRNNILSLRPGCIKYLDKYFPERICEKCGVRAAICGSLQHKGAGARQIKRQRGMKQPSECTLEELETQDKLMKKCGDGSRLEYLCMGCHRVEDLSTITRIAFGDIDVRSIEARSWRNNIEKVMRYKAIMTARCEDHGVDLWTNEPLQPINSPRDDAHHSTSRYNAALYDKETGEMFALDTAKRECEKKKSGNGLLGGDSMDDFIDRNARHLAVTISMDVNHHRFLHIIIGLVESGQLNCGVLPFDCRGGHYIVPVGKSENRDLYDILTKYKSWFEKIDATKVLACPKVSLGSGNILEDVFMGDAHAEDENVAKDGDVADSTANFDVEDDKATSTEMIGGVDQNVPANSQLAVGYRKFGKCPLAPIKDGVRQQQYYYDDDYGALDGQNLFGHIHSATEDFGDMNVEEGEEYEAYRHLHLSLKESDEQYGELERKMDSMLAAKEREHNLAIESMESKLSAIIAANEEEKTMLLATIDERDAAIASYEETLDRRDATIDGRNAIIAANEEEKTELLATIDDLSSLTKQMEKLACESKEKDEKIAVMQVKHESDVVRLEATHRGKMEEMDREHNQIIGSMKAAQAREISVYANRVSASDAAHAREVSTKNEQMAALEAAHAAAISTKDEEMAFAISTKNEEMTALEEDHARELLTKDKEMSDLRDDCANRVAALEAAHTVEISAKNEEMESLTEQMETMVIERDQTIESMQVEHNTHVARLEATHRDKMEEMDREISAYDNRVAALDKEMTGLRDDCADRLVASDAAHAAAIATKDEVMAAAISTKNEQMAALEAAHAAAIATKDKVMAAAISTKNEQMAALEAAHAAAIATKDKVMAAAISTKNEQMAALEAAHAAAIATKDEVMAGFDIFILPEGQLNPTPEAGLQPVFGSPYAIAKSSKRPIQMIGLHGCNHLWSADENVGMKVVGRDVKVKVFPPCKKEFGSAEEFIDTFNAVVGTFGASGQESSDEELERWLQ